MQTQDMTYSTRFKRLCSMVHAAGYVPEVPGSLGGPGIRKDDTLIADVQVGNRMYYEVTPGGSVVAISRQPPVSSDLCTPTSLNGIASYLRNYMTEFRNEAFYPYACDGDAYYIDDGNGDMFDDGNYTTPWLLSGDTYVSDDNDIEDYPSCINYGTITQQVVDTDFNYVSLGYIPYNSDTDEQSDTSRLPLTALGFRCSGPVGWQIGGNLGADGDGDMSSNIFYTGQSVNGFSVHAAYRQVYNANDPTICNLFILLGHSAWDSQFGEPGFFSDEDTNSNGCYFHSGEGSRNILAIHTLLSKPDDDDETPIPESELQTIVGNFTRRIAESLSL